MSNTKGDRTERELVRKLADSGFAVIRAPASGSATDRSLPDVLAGDGDRFYAIEAKSSSGDPIYLTDTEVESLIFFARQFGAKARVGVRFDGEPWFFFHPGELHRTDGGNYRVKLETALADGTEFPDFVATADAAGHDGGSGANNGGWAVTDVLRAVAAGDLTVEDGAALLE